MYHEYYGKASDVLVIDAEHAQLNPTIDPKIIERAMAEDPEAARAEWYGQFRGDVSQYLPDDLIDAAIIPCRTELPWTLGLRGWYMAFCDPSGGAHDAMTMAIAHKEFGFKAEVVILIRST